MNKKVNIELFLADYKLALEERDNLIANKDAAVEAEKQKVEALVGFSDKVKATLLAEVIAEKEAEFDMEAVEAKVAGFEKYLEEVEHPEDCECEECLAKRAQIAEKTAEQVA